MGAGGGILKHLAWIVPLTIFAFWYVTQQQRVQTDDMKVESAKFDEDFAAMSSGLSTGEEKKHWKASQADAHERHAVAREKALESNEKADDTFAAMEEELNAVDGSNMGENR